MLGKSRIVTTSQPIQAKAIIKARTLEAKVPERVKVRCLTKTITLSVNSEKIE